MNLRFIYILFVLTAWLPLRAVAQNNGVIYQITATEYNALVDLYASTSGVSWRNSSGWTDPNATSWFRVTISGVQYDGSGNVLVPGHVVSIVLGNNRLIGNISTNLDDLSQLTNLDLSVNQLAGTIPDSLGNLSQLQSLHLPFNSLTGSIPAGLGNLSPLQSLDLSQNELTGCIPASLGNLSQLQNLSLNQNALTGPVPTALGGLSQLINLELDDNLLTGSIPGTFGNLSQLQSLGLSGNHLSGIIPATLGNLSHLGILDLQNTLVSGDVPDFTTFTNVTLNINGNYLNIKAGSQSLANINAMIAAGNTVIYVPQYDTYVVVTVDPTSRFGFYIAGPSSVPITVRASTNLASTTWTTVQSCTLTNGSIHFSDPQWTNYPSRFYRVSSP